MGSKFLFAILFALTNGFGIPSFLQGRKKTGIVRLIVAFVTFGIGYFIIFILGILQAVQIMGMSDEEFAAQKYIIDKGIPSAKMLGEGGAQKSSGASYEDGEYDEYDEGVSASDDSGEGEFSVLLDDCGYDKNAVLQAIVEIKECSLEEAISVADMGIVLQDVSEEEADRAVAMLREAGATVSKEEGYADDVSAMRISFPRLHRTKRNNRLKQKNNRLIYAPRVRKAFGAYVFRRTLFLLLRVRYS